MTDIEVVPQNREAEESVIGSILINPDSYYDVITIIKGMDFYLHRHRFIFDAFTRLVDKGQPIDFVTVTNELELKGELAEIGGPAFLAAVISNTPSSLHAETYAEIIRDCSIKRKMLDAANGIAKAAYTEAPASVVMEKVYSILEGIEGQNNNQGTALPAALSRAYERAENAPKNKDKMLKTGLIDLDKILRMRGGDLILFGGRPGCGKTGLLVTIALHEILRGRKGIFFSLEMSEGQIVDRLVAQFTALDRSDGAGVDLMHIADGEMTDDEMPLYIHAFEVLDKCGLRICDRPVISPAEIRAICQPLQARGELDFVIVDYLQLMEGVGENRNNQVAYISRNLKKTARVLNVPLLAAVQLSRKVEDRADKEPGLADMRDSGSLEQDADAVIFISQKGLNIAQLKLAKQRNGPTGTVEAVFRQKSTSFVSAMTRQINFEAIR